MTESKSTQYPTWSEVKTTLIEEGTKLAMNKKYVKLVTKKLMVRVATGLESKAAKKIFSRVLSVALKKIAARIAVKAAAKFAVRYAAAAILACTGPVGLAIDVIFVILDVISFISDLIDVNNYALAYTRETVQEMQNSLEDEWKKETLEKLGSGIMDPEYPVEVNYLGVSSTQEWTIDTDEVTAKSLSYSNTLLLNLNVNSLGEVIDLKALGDSGADTDDRLLTHPPSWNECVQQSIQSIVKSNERAMIIQHELDGECKQINALASISWITFLTVGCTIALTALKRTTFTRHATNKPK